MSWTTAPRSSNATATTGRRSARRCALVPAMLVPASISMPISAAWRSAPKRSSLGRAFIDARHCGHRQLIVAVRSSTPAMTGSAIAVVSPCGACRELIFDYDQRRASIVPNVARRRSCRSANSLPQQIPHGDGAYDHPRPHSSPPSAASDDAATPSLRPQRLSEFVGQAQARANLAIFIEAARKRERGARPRAVRRPARASARPRWRRSSRASSASTSAPRRAR